MYLVYLVTQLEAVVVLVGLENQVFEVQEA